MNIGKFTYDAQDDLYAGEINTLTLHIPDVEIRSVTKNGDNGPEYRLYIKRPGASAEFGSAWVKRGQNDKEYLSVVVDDPAFSGPLNAALFPSANGDTATLVWNRPKPAPAKGKKK
ncbi:MAG: hypothetical protein A4S14_14685 [Proteobacteria bacterium SG_bin9]|nr:MAG: hypothetical protein A4S14_14685 [Proteobacteria bacterium SG_bin9]